MYLPVLFLSDRKEKEELELELELELDKRCYDQVIYEMEENEKAIKAIKAWIRENEEDKRRSIEQAICDTFKSKIKIWKPTIDSYNRSGFIEALKTFIKSKCFSGVQNIYFTEDELKALPKDFVEKYHLLSIRMKAYNEKRDNRNAFIVAGIFIGIVLLILAHGIINGIIQ